MLQNQSSFAQARKLPFLYEYVKLILLQYCVEFAGILIVNTIYDMPATNFLYRLD